MDRNIKKAEEKLHASCEKKVAFENAVILTKNGKLYIHNAGAEISSLADYLKNDTEFMSLLIGG